MGEGKIRLRAEEASRSSGFSSAWQALQASAFLSTMVEISFLLVEKRMAPSRL